MPRIDQPATPSTTRKTETTNTRQGIQRHDPESYRKKKNEDENKGFKDPYEDLTDVSISALKNFLEGLLQKNKQPELTQHNIPEPAKPNTPTAAGYSAYQSRSVQTPPPQTPSALDQAAAKLDQTEIQTLIRDLDTLANKGIRAITLLKGDSFLGSIKAGIARALENAATA